MINDDGGDDGDDNKDDPAATKSDILPGCGYYIEIRGKNRRKNG